MITSDDPWRDYRRRRNLALFAFLGYVLGMGLAAVTLHASSRSFRPLYILAFAWMVFAAAAGQWFIRFRCPRCGKPFFAKRRGYNTFVRKCLHCKLPLNAVNWQKREVIDETAGTRN